MFVCHGNICRSPMAEFVFKQLVREAGMADNFIINSTATSREEIGNGVHYGTRRVLARHGVPAHDHRAVQITAADCDSYDYIIIMDRRNRANLQPFIGGNGGKVATLLSFAGIDGDIADPWYTGDFDRTYEDVLRGCRGLLSYFTKK